MRLTLPCAVCVVLFVYIGCGPSNVGPSDSGTDSSADVIVDAGYPGPHPAVPQVQNQQGPVLTAPNVIPIFFMNDSEQTEFEDFLNQLAQSSFWGQATSEYGAGPLTIGSSIVVTDTPPATIDVVGIETWLEGHLDSDAGWPAATQNDIFTVFYPSSTTITDPNLGTSCTDFNSSHTEGIVDTSLVYVVMPRCPSAGNLTGFDALSAGLSHELIEAATDPLIQSKPAWVYTDNDDLIWSFIPGAEIADMCALEPQSFQRLVGSYIVSRPWSNASALAGHDPCVPVLSQPYFNAAPVFTENVNIAFDVHYVVTKGVQIALNQSKTVDVELFSDAPMSDWSVQAIDTTQPPGLTFAWDAQTGNNGDTLHLTITRTAPTSSEFVIESTSGMTTNLWFGFVAD